ncbi:Protein TOXD [Colletotrichum siamense]|uniref:Protein TOXD n=1 Tax=Colletotrichum siamense TaxID=690259 RepID=A0A9P5BMM9_COLSI|nr:Protein TOXD [Colletotrichum siamense]KAF4821711.1 Protein TOXD [Colletotrichum tropicale]KAI8153099.1 Protein TOXD [Colletotrichum sp. SAR 10_71]KAI8154938.1 Protein TOXD [Colletotrichum sp. SAR 10_70]KAI8157367.1 Protein TOXD [Colletotrichum sp. SAR 10_65]KAI8173731.1 Protein TOXD [Colletotrichum sp. SAR 10_75]KAI8198337.1 Protein TOXD [Colletotrichum sp. SAR 10_76]KAI8216342.1 Protein TOXD [Colletotrichum sp. SAR 10_77]KAI8218933.1 Protein TOXD [Colletotrichum sp. SAR 10_86]KAJ499555
MAQNQAVKTIEAGVAKVVDAPVPKLPADDYILVKTTAVAINPTDWKHVDLADKAGCVGIWVGCDYAGIVEEVGSGVTKDFKKGDRICGPVNGSNALREIDGAFAKYIAVKGDLQIKTPDNITDEEAATLGIAVTTVGQGLYQTLKLPLPSSPAKEPKTILIYGGSTAMGISGIQYAKLSGYDVITTASPHNFDYLKELGASAVFDYKSPTVSEDIRKHTGDALTLAWDCQSTDESAAIVARALSSSKPSLVGTLLPVDKKKVQEVNPNADVQMSLYYTVFGEEFGYFGKRDAVPENYEFGKRFWELSRELLAAGKLKPIRVIKNRGGSGLDGVIVGLKELKEGKVSAGKLVYTI